LSIFQYQVLKEVKSLTKNCKPLLRNYSRRM